MFIYFLVIMMLLSGLFGVFLCLLVLDFYNNKNEGLDKKQLQEKEDSLKETIAQETRVRDLEMKLEVIRNQKKAYLSLLREVGKGSE